MPSLPQRLRKPHPYLALLFVLALLGAADLFRTPEKQMLGTAYRSSTHAYRWSKTKCGCEGSCRFSPTCSRYSEEAVEHYGMAKGLQLTYSRLRRCKTNVPLGTPDPLQVERPAN